MYTITNGQGNSEDSFTAAATRLLDAKLDVMLFSIDIGTPEMVETVRHHMDYGQVMKNLKLTVIERDEQKANTRIGVSSVVTPKSMNSLDESIERLRDVGAEFVLVSPLVTTKNYHDANIYEDDSFPIEELDNLAERISVVSEKYDIPVFLSPDICSASGKCALMRHAYILPSENGENYFYAICHNFHSGGENIPTKYAYSKKMKKLAQGFEAYLEGKDSSCLKECEGCLVPELAKYRLSNKSTK